MKAQLFTPNIKAPMNLHAERIEIEPDHHPTHRRDIWPNKITLRDSEESFDIIVEYSDDWKEAILTIVK